MAMTLVSTVTVGSGGAASIEFTNIPQTGKDLLLLFSGRSVRSGVTSDDCEIFLNGITTANYDRVQLLGLGSSVSTFKSSSSETSLLIGRIPAADATANTFGNIQFYISNYTSSSDKSTSLDGVTEDNATASRQELRGHRFITGSAITTLKIQIYLAANNIGQYSTASLYIIS